MEGCSPPHHSWVKTPPSQVHLLTDPSFFLFLLEAIKPLSGLFSFCFSASFLRIFALLFIFDRIFVYVFESLLGFYWNFSYLFFLLYLNLYNFALLQIKQWIICTWVLDVWISWHTHKNRWFYASMTVKVHSTLFATSILMKFGFLLALFLAYGILLIWKYNIHYRVELCYSLVVISLPLKLTF